MRLLPFQVLLWSLLCLPSWAQELSGPAQTRITEAERELRLAEISYRRAHSRLQELQEDPQTSTEALLAMETYVHELEEVVNIRRQTLEDLRNIAGQSQLSPDPTVQEGLENFERTVGSVPSAEPEETEQERLDREFAESLEKFDGMILAHHREVEDQIAARSARGEAEASPRQTAAAEAEALLRSMGVDPGTGEEVAQQETGDRGQETSPEGGETAGQQTGNVGEETASGQRGEGGESRPPRENEDVVARQLREAAEKETDPVLREKLWKEYEAYLDGRS